MQSKPYGTGLISEYSKADCYLFWYTKYSALTLTFYTYYPWTFPEFYQCNLCSDIQGTKWCFTCQDNYIVFTRCRNLISVQKI